MTDPRDGKDTDVFQFDSEKSLIGFFEELRKERDQGFGFVPLVGAGLSAPSGVPIIQELAGFLRRCIAMALGLDHPDVWVPNTEGRSYDNCAEFYKVRRWQPWSDDWPSFGDPQVYPKESVGWTRRLGDVLKQMDHQRDDEPEFAIFQEAFGAMSEWRSSLLFIARLRHDENSKPGENRLRLADPDLDLIDRFFLNVVRDKQPTLGHRGLVLLTDLLRIDTVLTTNFDILIERAFRLSSTSYTVFDVHLETGLPPFRHLQGERSVIKLHGGRYGLRADYSLDALPSETDRLRLVSYLAGQVVTSEMFEDSPASPVPSRRHLLVAGFSGNDVRVNKLIETAYLKLDEDFRIFWLAHSQTDVESFKRFRETLEKAAERNGLEFERDRIVCLRHPYLGLMFLQLFQYLSHGLPPSGVVFPAPPRLAVPCQPLPVNYTDSSEERIKETQWEISQSIEECQRQERQQTDQFRRLVVVRSEQGIQGASTIAAREFDQRMEMHQQCIWIEMDEVSSAGDLFEQILSSVSRKAGIVDWLPLLRTDDGAAQVREIRRITDNPDRQWVIFLNSRDGAGSVFSREDKMRPDRPNGWLDDAPSEMKDAPSPFGVPDQSACRESFIELVDRLSGPDCPNVSIVLVCYEGPLTREVFRARFTLPAPVKLSDSCLGEFSYREGLSQAIKWCEQDKDRYRFLAALVLANRARYPAALLTWAYHGREVEPPRPGSTSTPEMTRRFDCTQAWLNELEELGVIRRKPGGLVWLHTWIRGELRDYLNRPRAANKTVDPETFRLFARIHHAHAEWYRKLFLSSRDPLAVCEIVSHRCLQAANCLAAIRALMKESNLPEDAAPLASRAAQALQDGVKSLHLGRKAMLGSGFSRSTCRRLDHLRKVAVNAVRRQCHHLEKGGDEAIAIARWMESLCADICIRSLKLNREVAQEVAENATAFRRVRELRDEIARAHLDVAGREELKQSEKIRSFDEALTPALFHPQAWEWPSQWFETYNDLGTLMISVRCYQRAGQYFEALYDYCGFPRHVLDSKVPFKRELAMEIVNWASAPRIAGASELPESDGSGKYPLLRTRIADLPEHRRTAAPDERREICRHIVKTLQRHLQLHLVQGQATHLQSRRDKERQAELRDQSWTHYQTAEHCYRAAIEVLNFEDRSLAQPAQLRPFYDERQRLETQYGLALSYLRDFYKGHRRLNEAEACLEDAHVGRDSMEFGIIELHRAEILTQQSVFLGNIEDVDQPTQLGQMRQQLLDVVSTRPGMADVFRTFVEQRRKTGKEQKEIGEGRTEKDSPKTLQQSQTYLSDAANALARAKTPIERQRKNVWWTTWFFELKMKIIELQLFAALATPDEPLPFAGLESAPLGSPTEIDRLMENAIRMVRLDIFRMARIVESYSNCLYAVFVWQVVKVRGTDVIEDSTTSGAKPVNQAIQYRIRIMHGRLKEAFDELRKRRAQKSRTSGDVPLDSSVKEYADYVEKHATNIIELTLPDHCEVDTEDRPDSLPKDR